MNAKKTVSKKKKAIAAKKTIAKKKVAVKKKVARKAPVKAAAPANVKAIAARQTKTQIIADLAEETGLDKKQIASVFSALGRKIEAHVKPRGSGEFTIPETGIKVARVIKPRTKARMGRNPATGEAIKIPAKTVVKFTVAKACKDYISPPKK